MDRRGFFGALAGLVLVRPAVAAVDAPATVVEFGAGTLAMLHGRERVMSVLEAIERGGPAYAKFRKLAAR